MTLCTDFSSIHYYSGFTIYYLRIRSWWHLETYPRLQEEDIGHYFCVFGALASQASKSEPTRKDQDRPQKFKIVLSMLLQPPVSSSIDSQSLFSEDSPNYLPQCEEWRLYKPLRPIEYLISTLIRRPTSINLFFYLSSKQIPTTTYRYHSPTLTFRLFHDFANIQVPRRKVSLSYFKRKSCRKWK